MTLRLVDSGWSAELTDALRADGSELRIICPFIKTGALERLLAHQPRKLRVITRFNLDDFAEGVSDISALERLLEAGGTVRGVKNLHAKIYIFGSTRAIVTSCNLTQAALDRNHEFGIVSMDPVSISTCRKYFDDLWNWGTSDLTAEQLKAWQGTVTRHRASGSASCRRPGLGDFGADAGISPSPSHEVPVLVSDAPQAFVKFLGEANNRVALSFGTVDEIFRAGCESVLAYPASKRPTRVREDAVMFVARMTKDPNDMRIFGRAVALRHEPGRDDATLEDIARRDWRRKWSRYIRVHHAAFVAGSMANGVPLNELMDALGSDAFRATQENARRGDGSNTNPRRAYLQHAQVELSREGRAWLEERLQRAFEEHGTVPQDTLDAVDGRNLSSST